MRRGSPGSGIPVNPERLRAARLAAGLSMSQLAGKDVSRTFIHLIEKGESRPSAEVLRILAKRTGKPVDYFTVPGTDQHLTRQQLGVDLARLASRVRRLARSTDLAPTERAAIKLLETSLRQGAALIKHV